MPCEVRLLEEVLRVADFRSLASGLLAVGLDAFVTFELLARFLAAVFLEGFFFVEFSLGVVSTVGRACSDEPL